MERELAVLGLDLDRVTADEFTGENLLCQRIFELYLDRTLSGRAPYTGSKPTLPNSLTTPPR